MKYYSEITKKVYDSVDELNKAEEAVNEKTNARKKAAEEVDKACTHYIEVKRECDKTVEEARKHYEKALADFCSKYGVYHKSFKFDENDKLTSSLSTLIDNFLF